jgi:cyclophilin family peptidyl-prolyl cis-trans isomerase
VPHIVALMRSGCYNSNHFFRVDKGFVAQTQDVIGGGQVPLSDMQKSEAEKSVPLEVVPGVKHHTGSLSMGRHADPNSGKSSFSILLGDAAHLDMQYTIFGYGSLHLLGPCLT